MNLLKEKFSDIKNFLKKKKLDAIILFNIGNFIDPNIQYFTNFKPIAGLTNCIFLLTKEIEDCKLFLSEEIGKVKTNVEIIWTKKFKLKEILSSFKFKRIGVNKYKIPAKLLEKLKRILKCGIIDVNKFLLEIRSVKVKDEIKIIKKVTKLTNKCIKQIENRFSEFKNENEISDFIDNFAKSNNLKLAFPTIAASGKRSSLIHPVIKKRIEFAGYIDFGFDLNGYKTDVTIPFIKKKTREVEKFAEILLESYEIALENLRVGNMSSNIYKKVEDFLKKHGFGLRHALGHGLGLEVHELPSFDSKSKYFLKNGNVFTIEPGIYVKTFGLRIEDDFLLWKNKLIPLTQSFLLDLTQ